MSRRQLAVALGYRAEEGAPKVLAKGGGYMAEKIVALAREQGISITSDEALVESLHQLDVGTLIPEELYEAVVEILVFIAKMEKRR
jgi:flagellar biosynthesis protein